MYIIDIDKSNYSPIFSCGLGDTRTDEFKITRNGHPVTFVNPTVELNAIKKDGNTVHQTDNITYVNEIFRVKYDAQFFTCKSVGEAEFVIVDNERTTTARFYFYVRDTIAEGIIGSITDEYLKKAYQELESENVKLNVILNENEAVRSVSEQERKSDETVRKSDEVKRVEAESGRAAAEVKREKRVQEVEKKIEVNTSQLAEMAKEVKKPLIYGELKMPSDFTPILPCKIYRDNDGLIKHNFNFNKYKGGTKIYVKANGNDTTGDGSETLPYRTLKKAFSIVVAGTDSKYEIITDIDMFNRDQIDFATTLTNKTLAVISTNANKSVISSNSSYSWTQDGNGTYKATRSGVTGVIDNLNRDLYGLPIPLKKVSTLVECQTTKSTWYTDNASVWVHRSDEISPSQADTIINIGVVGLKPILSNSKIYFENFIFCGFIMGDALKIEGTKTTLNDEACFNSCYFVASNPTSGNCLTILNVKNTYVFNCIGAYAQLDGFNYHFGTDISSQCFVLEYNCKAYHLGIEYPNNASNNASSIHDGANILRIGTVGYENTGATIIDVNGCYSILYDCHVRSPIVNGVEGTNGTGFMFTSDGEGVGKGKTYLINCTCSNAENSLNIGSTHTAYVNNFKGDGKIIGAGIINYI